jgi:hypothetical protein
LAFGRSRARMVRRAASQRRLVASSLSHSGRLRRFADHLSEVAEAMTQRAGRAAEGLAAES